MDDRIRVNLQHGVADVRLVRADKMNALDDAMFAALRDTGERLKTTPGVRAVVLSGEGRAFCAGLDTANFGRMATGQRGGERLLQGERTPGGANPPQHTVMVWRELPVPVIAAVHGVAYGGGFQLMLAAALAGGHAAEVGRVQPGAEGAAFTRQHHHAHAGRRLQALPGVAQRREHRVVERVHLVCARQAHVGHAVLHAHADSVVHGVIPLRWR